MCFDRWIGADEWSDVTREQRKDKAVFNFHIFSDSSWGDDRSTRRSTSLCVMFLNGAYISSCSRTQATVVLSSCEAELYAANAAIAEGLFQVDDMEASNGVFNLRGCNQRMRQLW